MGTIKDMANQYKPTAKVRNISELNSIDTDLVVLEDSEAEFPYNYIEVGGEKYKIPTSVLASLKVIL